MGLGELARLGAFLSRVSKDPGAHDSHPGISLRRGERTPGGVPFDLYMPQGRARGGVVAVHGATPKGREDHRLQHFARSVALSGMTCVVPTLAGLSDFCWTAEDLDRLTKVVAECAERSAGSVGLIGFSYGASYSIIVAGRSEVAHDLGFVLAFGAYHALEPLFERQLPLTDAPPRDPNAWDDWVYMQLLQLHRQRQRLKVPKKVHDEAWSLLCRYCHEATVEEKATFLDTHLRDRRLLHLDFENRDSAALAAISPAGQLGNIVCDVGLIHAPNDFLVPESQAHSLHRELCVATGRSTHRLLVTSLLSHVTLTSALSLREMGRLVSMLLPIVRGRA